MAANDEILGISGHLDINDIESSITELLSNLDKIGVKTEVLSKRMTDAMREIASSTDDSVTKQKKAMEVLEQGYNEAKAALANYPEQLRLAKNEMEQTEIATSKLEKEFANLNTQLQSQIIGSDKFNELKTAMSGVEQQIQNNHKAYDAQLATIQEMEAGYNGLVSMMGAANVAGAANAVAHGSVAATTTVEAGAHTVNAQGIGKETEEYQKQKDVIDQIVFTFGKLSAQDTAINPLNIETITTRFNELKDTIVGLQQKLSELEKGTKEYKDTANQLADTKEYFKDFGDAFLSPPKPEDGETDKYEAIRQQLDAMREVQQEMTSYTSQQQTASEAQVNASQRATQATKETAQAVRDTTKAVEQENEAASKEPTGFKAQWNNVNELHSKIQALTKELQGYEEEYDKMAEKPGFDEQSKKAQELLEKINNLKNEISNTKQEMHDESGVGGFLAKFKNGLVDTMTGNGKFQESLGNLKTALGGLLGPFTAATAGAKAFVKALWSMAATPIGAVITVIVLGLKAIHTWMKKDADGQKALAKITAYFSSLLSSLTDLAVKIGKYLYHAFADPQGPMNQFGKGLVGLVVNPLKALAKTLSGVGKIAGGVIEAITSRSPKSWAEAIDKMKDGWEDLKKAGTSAIDTFKSLWDTSIGSMKGGLKIIGEGIKQGWMTDLSAAGSDMFAKASKAARLAEQELVAQKQLSEAKRDEKLLDIEIAKEREKIYMLTGKEKDAQIEKVKNMLKEKYQPQIKAQETLLDIQKQRNKLHTVSLEQLAKEREAQGAVYALQAQAAASTRMLVRMQQANLKSMANADKKDARKEQQISDAEAKYNDVVYKNALAEAKAQQKMEDMIADARIAAMKEGAEKYIAEKNRALEKELEQIEQQRKDAIEAERARQKAEFEAQEKVIKARGGKTQQWDDSKIDQTRIANINTQYETLKNLTVGRQQNDEYQKQIDALRNYLKEYGTFQQKKQAIAEEYAKKIEEAEGEGNIGEKLRLQSEERAKQASLQFEQLKNSINWEAVFNDLDNMSTKALEGLKEKLRAALSEGSVTPENAKVLSEKILQIEDEISNRTNVWSNLIPALKERERITKEVALLEKKAADSALEAANANAKLSMTKMSTKETIEKATGKEVSFNDLKGTKEEILKRLGIDETHEKFQEVSKALDNLIVATDNAAQAEQRAAQAKQSLDLKQDILSGFKGKGIGAGISDIMSNAVKAGGGGSLGIASLIQTNANSMAEFTDKIGLAGTDFGNAVHGFAEGCNGFMSAVQALASGDIFGAVNGVLDGFSGIGKMVDSIGGGWLFGNDDGYQEALDKWGWILDTWKENLSYERELMEKAYGGELLQKNEKALEDLKNTQRAAANIYRGWAGDGAGLFSHSNGYNVNEDVNWRLLRNSVDDGTYGMIDENVSNLFNLDWKELERIKHENAEFWSSIHSVAQGYLDQYIEAGKAAEELQKETWEKLTTTTADDVFKGFLDQLYGLARGSKDVFDEIDKNWQEMVNKMVINNLIGANMKGKLEKWYEKLAKLNEERNDKNNPMSDTVYKARLEALKKEYDKLVAEGKEEIKTYSDMGLIKETDSEGQQKATFNSAKNITYEQTDSLVGIETAQQIVMEQVFQEQLLQTGYQSSIAEKVQQIQPAISDMKDNIAIIAEAQTTMNNHLADISHFTSVLPDMQEDLYRLRKVVEEQ